MFGVKATNHCINKRNLNIYFTENPFPYFSGILYVENEFVMTVNTAVHLKCMQFCIENTKCAIFAVIFCESNGIFLQPMLTRGKVYFIGFKAMKC